MWSQQISFWNTCSAHKRSPVGELSGAVSIASPPKNIIEKTHASCRLAFTPMDEVTHQSNYKCLLLPTPTTACSIRGQLDKEVTGRLLSAFILSRLDYCNAILVGLPASTLAPLQRVMHAAARGRHQAMRPRHTDTQSPALASSQAQDRVQVMSAGSSSHQLTGTCLPAESPHNYCIRVWSYLKPLGQQQ